MRTQETIARPWLSVKCAWKRDFAKMQRFDNKNTKEDWPTHWPADRPAQWTIVFNGVDPYRGVEFNMHADKTQQGYDSLKHKFNRHFIDCWRFINSSDTFIDCFNPDTTPACIANETTTTRSIHTHWTLYTLHNKFELTFDKRSGRVLWDKECSSLTWIDTKRNGIIQPTEGKRFRLSWNMYN